MSEKRCALCDQPVSTAGEVFDRPDIYAVNCESCGRYLMSGTALHLVTEGAHKNDRYRLSGLTRNASDSKSPIEITSQGIDGLVQSAPVPKTPMEALERLLIVIHDRLPGLTDGVLLKNEDWPLIFARSFKEFRALLELLKSVQWVTLDEVPKGWLVASRYGAGKR